MSLLEFYHSAPAIDHSAADGLEVPGSYRSLFNTIATLIDLPDDGRHFGETKPIVQCLIEAWLDETAEQFTWEAFDEFYNSLATESDLINTWGVRESNPAFSFLMHSSKVEITSQYKALVPFFLKRINRCHQQVVNPGTLYCYHLALAARKILVNAPSMPPISRFDWSFESKLLLAINAINDKKVTDSVDLTTSPDWAYIEDLLFRNRKKLGKRGGGSGGVHKSRWILFEFGEYPILHKETEKFDVSFDVDGDQGCFFPDIKGDVNYITRAHPNINPLAIKSAGEHEVDYIHSHAVVFPAHWFGDPWQAKRRIRGKQEAMVANERILPWDKRCLSLRFIRIILNQVWQSDVDPCHGILAFSLLLGSPEKIIKKIHFGRFLKDGDPDQGVTEKLMQGFRYFDPKKRILWWLNLKGAEDNTHYLYVPPLVHLKLPRMITKHMPDDGVQNGTVFSATDFRKAKKNLRILGNDGLGLPTFKRLQQTFEAYFIHGGGMPEIVADHLQGKIRNHLISQHYYITTPWESAAKNWRRMVGVLLRNSETTVSRLVNKMAFIYEGIESNNQVFTGAVKTPNVAALRSHAALLLTYFSKKMIDMRYSSPQQWNAYVSYIYLIMGVCTGRRPQRDPFPVLSDFDLVNSCLFIDDKWNKTYRESRIIPLCRTLHKAISDHLQIHDKCFMKWKLNGYSSSSVAINQLFLVDEDANELVKVTPNTLDRLSGLTVDQAYFENLGNGCRHFLLTQMHIAGVPQDLIDFISGHRHIARETEMSSSVVSWEVNAKIFQEFVENKIVVPLGLRAPLNV